MIEIFEHPFHCPVTKDLLIPHLSPNPMVIRKILRHLLGVEALNNQVSNLESQRLQLEARIIKSDERHNWVARRFEAQELASRLLESISCIEDRVKQDLESIAAIAVKAEEAVARYGFKRFEPPICAPHNTCIISLDEFRAHPELYWHKLSEGILNFPIGLNFHTANDIMRKMFGNCGIDSDPMCNSSNGYISFALSSVLGYSGTLEGHLECEQTLRASMELSELERSRIPLWIHLDPLDFLHNFDGLTNYFLEQRLDNKAKERAIAAMETLKLVYLTALELVGTTKIKNPVELLDFQETGDCIDALILSKASESPEIALKYAIRKALLTGIKGARYGDIQMLLAIRSKDRFRELAGKRTADILASDRKRKGFTATVRKPLEQYSIGEYITLACYFARNIITNYEDADRGVERVFSNQVQRKMSGKCTDVAGLALHYLREYLAPLNRETFNNWVFAYEIKRIGKFNHCLIKAVHINPDLTADVYFIDPSRLMHKGLKSLRKCTDILKSVQPNLPLLIERDAEDLLYKPE